MLLQPTWQKFLSTAQGYPWRLVQGHVPSNLEVLRYLAKSDAQDLDDATHKVWSLLQQCYGHDSLAAGVQLLAEIRWTTTIVEQGHASASLAKKAHAGYGVKMIASRAHLHMIRPLLQQPPVPRHLRSLEAEVQHLQKRAPQRLSGKALFFVDTVK